MRRAESLGTARKRSIVVSLPDHRISILENGYLVRVITEFSTGRAGHVTPLIDQGKLDPTRRERMHYSQVHKDHLGNSAAMPFALFFEGVPDCAFHAGNPTLESYGCIHLRRTDAEWLFHWAGKNDVDLRILGPYPCAGVAS